MAALSEWLQIMLAEIARKRDDLEQARAEEVRRATEEERSSNVAAPSSTANGPAKQEARVARR
jgi:hypothetical protein